MEADLVSKASSSSSVSGSSIPVPHLPEDWDLLKRIGSVFSVSVSESYQETKANCFNAVVQAFEDEQWSVINANHDDLTKLTDSYGRTLLIYAVSEWKEDWIARCIDYKVAIHECDLEGNTALHHAAKEGAVHLLQCLLSDIDVQATNHHGETPLHIAIQAGEAEAVGKLLDEGANVNSRVLYQGKIQVNALQLAVLRGETRCVDFLLETKECNVDNNVPNIGNLLHVAIYFSQIGMLKHLFEAHFPIITSLIERKNDDGKSPLGLAAEVGEIEALVFLSEKDANLESRDNDNCTPLHLAARGCQQNAISTLAYLGCDLFAVDSNVQNAQSIVENGPKTSEARSTTNLLKRLIRLGEKVRSAPPNFVSTPPVNLVFKGGGPKGIAYGGVIETLEATGNLKGVKRVAGTSAGAIAAMLLALGYNSAEIKDVLKTTDLTTFLDHPLSKTRLETAFRERTENIGAVIKSLHQTYKTAVRVYQDPTVVVTAALKALWKTTGICEGNVFLQWAQEKIANKVGDPHLTFGELHELVKKPGSPYKELHIFGTKLTGQSQIFRFSSEDPSCKDMIIADALRISMSIPGVFLPHHIHVKEDGRRVAFREKGDFVDGGMLYNLPVEEFDQKRYVQGVESEEEALCPIFNKRTLGFNLYSSLSAPAEERPVETVGDLLLNLAKVYFHAGDSIRRLNPYNMTRIVNIDVKEVGTLSFSLTDKQKDTLVQSGSDAVTDFFTKSSPNRFVMKREEINKYNETGLTQLHEAVIAGDVKKVTSLLNQGADPTKEVEKKDPEHESEFYEYQSLHIASKLGHEEIVRLLVRKKAPINGQGRFGRTSLHMSTHNGHLEITKFLLSQGANPNARAGEDDHFITPLHAAVGCDRFDIVAELLKSPKINLDVRDSDNHTPFYNAVQMARPGLVKLISESSRFSLPSDDKDPNSLSSLFELNRRNQGKRSLKEDADQIENLLNSLRR
ncbi:MAG: hypothetical protein K940chlam7_01382 [Chlamydiae bacterium]|nr:hypothetical protein [Chlamydiota bacterium]